MKILLKKPDDFQPKRTIVSCVIEHDWKILMLQRSEYETQPHTWCLPGWKLEQGEHPESCARREVHEETWIHIVCDIRHDGEYYVRSDWGDDTFHLFHHQCETKYDITLSEREHQWHQWMTPEEALGLELVKGLDFNLRKLFGL